MKLYGNGIWSSPTGHSDLSAKNGGLGIHHSLCGRERPPSSFRLSLFMESSGPVAFLCGIGWVDEVLHKSGERPCASPDGVVEAVKGVMCLGGDR